MHKQKKSEASEQFQEDPLSFSLESKLDEIKEALAFCQNQHQAASIQEQLLPAEDSTDSLNSSETSDKLEQLRNRVLQQILKKLQMPLSGKFKEVQFQLDPAYLGKLKIRLETGLEKVVATFIVSNQSAKELVQRSTSELQQALVKYGITTKPIEVEVASESNLADQESDALKEERRFEEIKEKTITKALLKTLNTSLDNELEEVETDLHLNQTEERIEISAKPQVLNIMA